LKPRAILLESASDGVLDVALELRDMSGILGVLLYSREYSSNRPDVVSAVSDAELVEFVDLQH